jgi:uncharacterized protein YndB with AHSA1/START domain
MSKGEIIAESAVRFMRLLPGPVERVWEFLTDAARLPQWYGAGNIEPREGGAVSLMGGSVRGVVTIWRPMQALGYTWNVFAPGETVSAWPVSYLEFALAADGGRVTLTLVHRPIPDAMQQQTAMGWHTYLDLIAAGLAGEFPGRADLFAKNAALYGIDMNNLKRMQQ